MSLYKKCWAAIRKAEGDPAELWDDDPYTFGEVQSYYDGFIQVIASGVVRLPPDNDPENANTPAAGEGDGGVAGSFEVKKSSAEVAVCQGWPLRRHRQTG